MPPVQVIIMVRRTARCAVDLPRRGMTMGMTDMVQHEHAWSMLHGAARLFLREGPSPRGAPSVPPFARVFPEKRIELKSLKGQTKAEEEGPRGPFLLSLRLSLKAL